MNHVIVTGAAGGIGAASVRELLTRDYAVTALDLSRESLDRLLEEHRDATNLLTVSADLTDSREVARAVSAGVERHGVPFGLLNVAGNNRLGRLEDITDEDWHFLLDANLTSTFLMCREVLPLMRGRGGRVINTSSIFGLRGQSNDAAYAAAKAGVVGLTRALAAEWASENVTVNCVAPVVVLTERVKRMPKEHLDRQLQGIPLGRFSTPQDVTRTYAFLLSEDGSFYTGQTFSPNGGDVMP